jgi:transketolase
MNNMKIDINKVLNGKIVIDKGGRVYFRVVRNIRNEQGRPANILIKTVVSAPVNLLKEKNFQIATIAKINEELSKLKSEGKMSEKNVLKVRNEFYKKMKEKFSISAERKIEKYPIQPNLLERYPILKP